MIYLDHNATTPLHPRALDAMLPLLNENWANPSSPYRQGKEARLAVERARAKVAECVGCRANELLFCSGGSESDNLAIRGVAYALETRGKHIVTTTIEHHAVLNTCKALERAGWSVTYVPVDGNGVVDLAALAASLRGDTVLVSIMHANNETGVLQPMSEVAALTRARGIALHSDAVQSVGKLAARFDCLGPDLISFSAHKLYGPKGVGALYVRAKTPLQAVITGGGQEYGLRAGTENLPGIVGFSAAISEIETVSDAEGHRLGALRDHFEQQVSSAIDGVTINGAGAQRVPNTSSLSFAGIDGESIVVALDVQGICVATGSACSTGASEPSHVLRAMGLSPQLAQGTIRVSMGRDTNELHVDSTVRALARAVERLRRISSTT